MKNLTKEKLNKPAIDYIGIGKQVIQLCKTGVTLHFDIAQKNTIMWESEEEIPERLANRIKATID